MARIIEELVAGGSGTIVFLLVLSAQAALILLAAGKVPLRYNVRNLALRWKTSLLTGLAFTAVIGILTVMLAFVGGMRRLTEGTGQPGNVLILSDGATDEAFSNLAVGDLTEIETQPAVVRGADGRPMASRETYMVVNQPFPDAPADEPKRRFVQVRGIEDPRLAAEVHALRLEPGGAWFSDAGVEETAGPEGATVVAVQTVLGQGIARELGRIRSPAQKAAGLNPGRLEVGDTFPLGERTFRVAGIMESSGSTFNSEIWAKRPLVAAMFGKDTYTSLVVRTRDAAAAARFKDFIHSEYQKASLEPHVEVEYYSSLSETNKQFLFAIVFVTVVMAVGGTFGVMNTMFAAISQRTKDIGVLRLLGYARFQILLSFLLESLVIALAGGLLGCALGSLADGWTATSVVSGHQGGGKFVVLKLVVDNSILGVGLLLSLLMGLLGGILPSLRAMRMRPLEALR